MPKRYTAVPVWYVAVQACASVGIACAGEPQPRYLTGGPLAGLDLPLFSGQHGEEPGYPGSLPELMAQGEVSEDMGNEYREWGPQGQAPEVELYPGSVEHFRAYMGKYMPIRSFWDRQSQVRNWVAPGLPGADSAHVENYAEPVFWVPRHSSPRPTGKTRRPVPVVRMAAGSPVVKLDLGELPVGLYVVRVIGAVEPTKVRPFRAPLYVRMTINDRLNGGTNVYRRRLGYCEQFYSVAEFYFHVAEQREYRAELVVDRGSDVDLLVHNISLDDMLAGMERRPLKTRTTTVAPVELESTAPESREDRLDRDAALWNAFPPINAQGSAIRAGFGGYGAIKGVSAGTDELTGKEIEEQFGKWVPWGRDTRSMTLPEGVEEADVFLANPTLGLVYTNDDLRAGRALPDPYPGKDDGAGLYYPDPNDPAAGRAWTPIGARVHQVYLDYYNGVGRSLGDASYDSVHDAAVQLTRFAYAFPTLDYSEYLHSTLRDAGPFGRDYSCRRRATAAYFLPHYPLYVKPIAFQYDRLFEFIRENALLAESVGRFVPWVKTPDDVIELIDTYLVQTVAKRILRYHYHTDPMDIANLAAVVGDRSVTDPWMEWLFSRTFVYPLPVAGIQDTLISGHTREGTEFVGSTYYAQGEGASRVAAALDRYLASGGNPKYDLSDTGRYPKPAAHVYWRMENVVAGQDFLRIGDVCGPDKAPGHTLRNLDFARSGWRWTRDPKFAFILKHFLPPNEMPADEWDAIRAAADEYPRAPWLENRSRVLPMWAGILEAGTEHDDYRFRRAAYLRVGYGMGHHHNDTFDLQVVAHGLPMTIDGGQRPGYSSPGDRTSRIHNTVEVDGRNHRNHSWVTALADHEGARYLAASAVPPEGCSLFRRQIALIDVGDGGQSEPLTPEQQAPFAQLPTGIETPNSYVFDVFRVAGGTQHTYCFHGPLHDDFQWNARNVSAPVAASAKDVDEAQYLSKFSVKPELSFAGDAPNLFQATWRMATQVDGPGMGEKEMAGKSYDPEAPRKFTRLHLVGVEDARAMRGQAVCTRWKYDYTNVMVQRRAADGEQLDSVFAAVIEPFAGEPFVGGVEQIPVSGGQANAGAAVAVQVTTIEGRVDICFANDRPDQVSEIPQKQARIAAEHAFMSTDRDGLAQATLVGGTLVDTPRVRIEVAQACRQANVVRTDYLAKQLWIDQPWPRLGQPVAVEIGLDDPEHKTTCTVTKAGPADDGSVLTLQRGADYYRSAIEEVRPDGTVQCTLKPLVDYVSGDRDGWVASNDDCTRFWRAKYLGNRTFRLTGAPVTDDAFGDARVLRLWEYGIGDTMSLPTSVSLRRIAPREFELTADIAVRLSLRAKSVERSADRKVWQQLTGRAADGWFAFPVPLDRPAHTPVYLRIRT